MLDYQSVNNVQDYYGKVLNTHKDLKTSACCSTEAFPGYIKDIMKDIHDEVMAKFYGCGSPIPWNSKVVPLSTLARVPVAMSLSCLNSLVKMAKSLVWI